MSVLVSATALRCRCSCFGYCMSIRLMSGSNGRNNAVVKTTSKHWLLEKTLFITNRKGLIYKLKEKYLGQLSLHAAKFTRGKHAARL